MTKHDNTVSAPQPGDRVAVEIETLASGGDAIAHSNGFTLFIPRGAPGDVAEVEISRVTPRFGRARIIDIQKCGSGRIDAPCPHYPICGGCQLQHIGPEAQLQAKRRFTADAIERIGKISGVEIAATRGMENPWQYRNKGEFTAVRVGNDLRLGYHALETDSIFPISVCPIQHPIAMSIVEAVNEIATKEGLPLAQLITRVDPDTNQALAIFVCWEKHPGLQRAAETLQERVPEIKGVSWSLVRGRTVVRRTLAEPLLGDDQLIMRLGEWRYSVSAESFFQVNLTQAEQLLDTVLDFAGPLKNKMIIDAYCGVGTFLLPLASQALRSIGIEEHPVALRDAMRNLDHYAAHNVRMYEGGVERVLAQLARKGREADVIVLDPPRRGAGRIALEQAAAMRAERVILISCDPAAFGRDAGDLTALGYRLTRVKPIDMFPQTWHVETVGLFERI